MNASNPTEPQTQTFFIRIHPQHSHFVELMSPREEEIMHQHFLYWKGELQRHRLILAGPVPIHPGTFGIIIVRAESEREAESMIQADPAVAAHVMTYELFPLELALYAGDSATSP